MAKNILAFFGLLFLTLIIVIGVWVVGVTYDRMGFVSLPKALIETPLSLLTPAPPTIAVQGMGDATWTNPLDALPIASVTAAPAPTSTPLPPMDPAAYRSEVMARMRAFADAMKRWLDANNALAKNNALLKDANWTNNMQVILEDVDSSGRALANVGPAPEEYQAISGWLQKIGPEADEMKVKYQAGMANGDSQAFADASSHFTAIKDDLTQAVNEMIKAGWTLQ